MRKFVVGFAEADYGIVASVERKWHSVMIVFDWFCAVWVGAFAVCFFLDLAFFGDGDSA